MEKIRETERFYGCYWPVEGAKAAIIGMLIPNWHHLPTGPSLTGTGWSRLIRQSYIRKKTVLRYSVRRYNMSWITQNI